jgi:hypothetical protein
MSPVSARVKFSTEGRRQFRPGPVHGERFFIETRMKKNNNPTTGHNPAKSVRKKRRGD